MFEETAFMEALQNSGRRFERREGVVNSALPLSVWQIGAESNAPTTPAERGKAAYLQKKLSVFLAESGGFSPIVNLQAWDNRVLRQRCRIKQPGVGDDLL